MIWEEVQYPSREFSPPGLDPATFEQDIPGFMSAVDQQRHQETLPHYESQYLYGYIANMPYFWLTTFANAHFGPNGTGDFAEPSEFDITVKSGEFEIRRPL